VVVAVVVAAAAAAVQLNGLELAAKNLTSLPREERAAHSGTLLYIKFVIERVSQALYTIHASKSESHTHTRQHIF
jgi:hypothetical protein